jgi:hypothetical protein
VFQFGALIRVGASWLRAPTARVAEQRRADSRTEQVCWSAREERRKRLHGKE